jgi:branched-chain amino acid transport system substrate-binding protein
MRANRSTKQTLAGLAAARVIWLLPLTLLFLAGACASNAPGGSGGGGGGSSGSVSDPYGVVRIKKGGTIHLGNSGVLSGANAVLGKEQENSVKLAVDQHGAVKGFKVDVVSGDDGCGDASAASAVANKFVSDDQMPGVIGTTCSSGMLAALPIYNKSHYAIISPSATSGKLPKQGFDIFFRVAWNDDNQGPAQADYIKNTLKKSKVAVLHDDSAYGQGLAQSFVDKFKDSSHQVIFDEEIKTGQPDYSSFVSRFKPMNPDLVYFAGFAPEAATLIRNMHAIGVNVPFLAGDGVRDPNFIDKAGKDAEGAYLTQLTGGASSKSQDFEKAYRAKYGNFDGAYLTFGADATNIMLDAIDKAGQVDSKSGDLLIGRKALRDAIAGAKYEGTTGTTSFVSTGDREPSQLKLDVSIVKDGKIVPAPSS